MILLYPFQRSADWGNKVEKLTVRSAYRTALNLMDHCGRRYSVLLDPEDYLPRSSLIEAFPPLGVGQEIMVGIDGASVGFDPSQIDGLPDKKLRGLWLEWLEFMDAEELSCLHEAIDEPERLIGLGPGYTPAGDDFLVGWIMALRFTGRKKSLLTIEREMLDRKTSWFSSEMIKDALEGRFWKRGIELVSAIADGDATRVLEKTDSITKWGHLSGKAWLAGLAYGLELGE